MSFNVNDFMSKLSQQTAPMAKREAKASNKSLDKISLNYEGNFGRYQLLPMNNVVTDYPYVTLFNTREICIPRRLVKSDGTEDVYNAWIRILPKNAYIMKDMTGRIVSSLTSEEDQILNEAYTVYDELFNEVDAKTNSQQFKDLIRKRNYTIFHAMCLNKWKFDDTSRTPERQNFCGLFVCTAKGFIQAVEDNINDKTLMEGGDQSWMEGIYNNNLTGRDGFVLFNISRSKTSAGYQVSVSHEAGRAKMLEGITIPAEDAELMKDPVSTFLGWQANREENVDPAQRRLFNASLIKEAISFMTNQLAAIRMAKNSGTDVMEAIKATNATCLGTSVANVSPDNEVKIIAGNTEPFATPAAAQIDPVTSAPVNNAAASSSPFEKPSFGNFGMGMSGDTPF